MSALRLAVIGAGHLGRIHARLLTEMPDVELVAVADPIAPAREQVAADNRCRAVADHRELLGAIDAAVIATPTALHHGVAVDFLKCGTHLLVEKPLAADLAEANEMVVVAQRHAALLQVGHIERFNPAFTAVAARIGQPRYVEAVRASGFTGRSTDIGVVHDLMIHDLDLLLSMVGESPVNVSAMGLAILGQREDVAQARLEFANGCVAHLSASRVSFAPMPKRQMQIWSQRGFAAIDFGTRSAQLVTPSEEILQRELDYHAQAHEERAALRERLFSDLLHVEPLEIEPRNALADELRDFVDSIRNQRAPRVTGEQGRNAVAAAEAILASMNVHRWNGTGVGPRGPLAVPEPAILRGPHWPSTPRVPTPRREAG